MKSSPPNYPSAREFEYRKAVLELAKCERDRLSPAEIKALTDDTGETIWVKERVSGVCPEWREDKTALGGSRDGSP